MVLGGPRPARRHHPVAGLGAGGRARRRRTRGRGAAGGRGAGVRPAARCQSPGHASGGRVHRPRRPRAGPQRSRSWAPPAAAAVARGARPSGGCTGDRPRRRPRRGARPDRRRRPARAARAAGHRWPPAAPRAAPAVDAAVPPGRRAADRGRGARVAGGRGARGRGSASRRAGVRPAVRRAPRRDLERPGPTRRLRALGELRGPVGPPPRAAPRGTAPRDRRFLGGPGRTGPGPRGRRAVRRARGTSYGRGGAGAAGRRRSPLRAGCASSRPRAPTCCAGSGRRSTCGSRRTVGPRCCAGPPPCSTAPPARR